MAALANSKHERFCQALAKGETADAAYVTAGYDADRGNAIRLKGKPHIQARVAELNERAATRAEISKSWVMERLAKNVRVCLGEEPLLIPGEDGADPTEEYQHNPAGANQALQLLGKELGMFVDRSISASTTLEEMLDRIDEPAGDAAPAKG